MATEQIATSRQLLDDSEREFEVGDICASYGRLWDAANLVVTAELGRRGMYVSSRQSMLRGVEQLAVDVGDLSTSNLYAVARACRSYSEFGFATDYEFEVDRPRIRRFVDRMAEFSNESTR